MPLKYTVAFYLAVSFVCIADCRPRDISIKGVKGVKGLPHAARSPDEEYELSHKSDGGSSFDSSQSSAFSSFNSGSFKSVPESSRYSGRISSSQYRSLTQAASSSISSSESDLCGFGGPSGSSSLVGSQTGWLSGHFTSSSHFGSTKTSHTSGVRGVAGSTDVRHVVGSHGIQQSTEVIRVDGTGEPGVVSIGDSGFSSTEGVKTGGNAAETNGGGESQGNSGDSEIVDRSEHKIYIDVTEHVVTDASQGSTDAPVETQTQNVVVSDGPAQDSGVGESAGKTDTVSEIPSEADTGLVSISAVDSVTVSNPGSHTYLGSTTDVSPSERPSVSETVKGGKKRPVGVKA